MNLIRLNSRLAIDLTSHRLYDKEKLSYKKIEPLLVRIIEYFVKKQGQLISRDELGELFWGLEVNSDEVLTQAIAKIRKLIRDDRKELIITIPKLGYKWVAESEYSGSLPHIERIDKRRNLKMMNWIIALIVFYIIFRFLFHGH